MRQKMARRRPELRSASARRAASLCSGLARWIELGLGLGLGFRLRL